MSLFHFSLFTGIGGLDLAAEWAGFETVGQCEYADYPTKVLEKHWPNVPRWRDIRDVTAESVRERGIEGIDVLSGGFPCQPHSVIGSRKAENDDRHLWPEFIRVIREVRPRWVVGENVNGILSTIHESVCSDLEAEGYEVRTFSTPAYAVGAHHERYRVSIIGISKSQPGLQADTEADSNGAQRETRSNSLFEPWTYLPGAYWAIHQPPVFGMADGLPYGMDRYKLTMSALGNAVVPQWAYPIFRAIAEIEKR